MEVVRVQKKNHHSLQIDCGQSVAMELTEFFSFFVPNYKFMPAFINKVWDGKIKLFNRVNYELPVGLYDYLIYFCKNYGYDLQIEDSDLGYPGAEAEVSVEELYTFVTNLNLHSEGKSIKIRDYQFSAVYNSIKKKRILLLSPTGSGKSLIIYVLLRWYMSKLDKKQLIIVPTTQLVEQMKSDFADYSSHDPTFNAEELCHMIYSGKEKDVDMPVYISTWQSIYKLQRKWFDDFRVIYGDEVHLFKADSLTKLMKKCDNGEYRIGTTGTLDDTVTNKMVLEGTFGRVFDVITTKELQDKGSLEALDIDFLILKHPAENREIWHKKSYMEEIDYLVHYKPRNDFITDVALLCKGNTLVLFNYVDKHGRVIYDDVMAKNKNDQRKIFFIHGGVDTSDREAVRGIVEKQENAIIVASLGTFSTGINIKNLHNIIFAAPSKSQIRVLQSIGRGLRRSENGQATKLYDIVDDVHWKGKENFALKHGAVRLKIYKKQEFNVKVIRMDLK